MAAMTLVAAGAARPNRRSRLVAGGLLLCAAAALLASAPAFHCGDRVRAKVPIQLSNDGRGYYNEGGGEGTAKHLRNFAAEIEKRDALEKIVDFGMEGTVVGVIPVGEWSNRPRHWKGTPRAGIMVNWDDADIPMDIAEQFELEITDTAQGDQLIAQRKAKKFGNVAA